jgi:methylenetetrahydrofolate reductase (NADPH)
MGEREQGCWAETDREGGSEPMKCGSTLERILDKGSFAITAQLDPPRGNDVNTWRKKAELLRGSVDALNIPDNRTATVHMCSMAAAALLVQMALEPVMQMVTRDRNRIAMQSDILGATALGIRNILCLTGDHQHFGNQADSKNVHDLDSLQLVDCVRTMRDQGTLLGGDGDIEGDLRVFIGAAANPFADPFEFRVVRLAKKISAGADFIQTQAVHDMERFKEWMRMVRDRGLHEKVHIMAGVTPLKSAEMARRMNQSVPGIKIPEALIGRLEKAGEPAEEGLKICVEQIEQLKETEGVHGIHVMAVEWEDKVCQIAELGGFLPRPNLASEKGPEEGPWRLLEEGQ